MAGVVIVGAGLGALRTAESLRASGYSGAITVIGDEPLMPYNRPPLSKTALAEGIDPSSLEFRRRPAVDDVTWRLDTRVTGSDLASGVVTLEDGSSIVAVAIVAATGLRPRRLTIPGPSAGRHVLRTVHDAELLRRRLTPGAHVLILGAGFIGCEVAATARSLGCDVTVVALDTEPMLNPLGPELAAAMRRRHEEHGVTFRLGTTVEAFTGDEAISGALLSDGSDVPVDVILEAVGSAPNTEWLAGNGLDLSDGVLVDSSMRVPDADLPLVAVGDVARYPLGLFDGVPRRIEHWVMPTETGRRAGRTLAAVLAGQGPDPEPFDALPSFWSDQYDHTIQSFGMPGLGSVREVVSGDLDGPCIVEYSDATGLVGVIGVDRTAELAAYRGQLLARADARASDHRVIG